MDPTTVVQSVEMPQWFQVSAGSAIAIMILKTVFDFILQVIPKLKGGGAQSSKSVEDLHEEVLRTVERNTEALTQLAEQMKESMAAFQEFSLAIQPSLRYLRDRESARERQEELDRAAERQLRRQHGSGAS